MKWLKGISGRGFIWVITLWQALWAKPVPSKVKNKWVSLVPVVCKSITIIPHVSTSTLKVKHPAYSFFQQLEWHPVSPLEADTPSQQCLTKAPGTRSIFFSFSDAFLIKQGTFIPHLSNQYQGRRVICIQIDLQIYTLSDSANRIKNHSWNNSSL